MAGEQEKASESENSLSTVASGGMMVFVGKIVALGFGFLSQVVMARLLTQDAYGEVILALTVINIVGVLGQLGIDDGVLRQYPHYEDEPGKARGVIRAALVIASLSGILTGTIVYLSSDFIAVHIFNDKSIDTLIKVSSIGIPFFTISSVCVALARSARDASVHFWVNYLARPFFRFFLITSLIVAGFGSLGATIGQVIAYVFSGILAFFLAWNVLPRYNHSPESMYWSVLSFSIPLIGVQVLDSFISQIDLYILGYFSSSSDVGIYNISLQLSNLLFPFLFSFSFLLPPVLTRLNDQKKTEEMQLLYQRITKWIIIFGLPLFLLLFFFPRLILGTVFGSGYLEAVTALRILLIGNLFAISTGLVTPSLVSLGENRIVFAFSVTQFLVNIILDIIFIPMYNMSGAALATTTAVTANNFLGILILYSRYSIQPINRSTLSLITALSSITIFLAGISSIFGVKIQAIIPIIGVIYPFLIIKLGIDSQDEELLNLIEERLNIDLGLLRRTVQLFT